MLAISSCAPNVSFKSESINLALLGGNDPLKIGERLVINAKDNASSRSLANSRQHSQTYGWDRNIESTEYGRESLRQEALRKEYSKLGSNPDLLANIGELILDAANRKPGDENRSVDSVLKTKLPTGSRCQLNDTYKKDFNYVPSKNKPNDFVVEGVTVHVRQKDSGNRYQFESKYLDIVS